MMACKEEVVLNMKVVVGKLGGLERRCERRKINPGIH